MLTCAVMYAMAAAHYFISFHGFILANNTSTKISAMLSECGDAAGAVDSLVGYDQELETLYDCVSEVTSQTLYYQESDCASSVLLLVNVSLFNCEHRKKLS